MGASAKRVTGFCRRCHGPAARRAYTTASGASSPSASLPAMVAALKRRPAKFIPDYLVPMPSHLLNTTLADLFTPYSPSTTAPTSTSTSTSTTPAVAAPPTPLPQGHHLAYFPLQRPPSALAPDGADPDHSPGAPFHRRLWAGGELRFRPGWAGRLLLDGRAWACREEIGDVKVTGGEGEERVFVDVWRRYGLGHEVEREGEAWDVEERRTLVFMRNQGLPPSSSTRLIKHPHSPTLSSTLTPTPAHLFHFSALTFNAHAIHLDPVFARRVDGHRAPLVHGPLSLALVLHLLASHLPPRAAVEHISYRNYAPLYVGEQMTVCLRPPPPPRVEAEESTAAAAAAAAGDKEKWDAWVEGPEGGMAVRGSVVVDLKGMER